MDISIKSFSQSISQFLHRFHVIIFVVAVLGCLGAAIWINYQNIVAADDSQGYTAQTNNITFVEATRKRLAEMHTSDYRLSEGDGAPREMPMSGRTNPFVE